MNESFMSSGEVNDPFMTCGPAVFTTPSVRCSGAAGGGAGGRCGVANGSLRTSEVPNESFATFAEPLSPDQERRLDFAGARAPAARP